VVTAETVLYRPFHLGCHCLQLLEHCNHPPGTVCILLSGICYTHFCSRKQQPLYRSTCVSWHLQLRTGGFCWCSFPARMPLLTATSAFGLGRTCYSSQQCYLCCLHTSCKILVNFPLIKEPM